MTSQREELRINWEKSVREAKKAAHCQGEVTPFSDHSFAGSPWPRPLPLPRGGLSSMRVVVAELGQGKVLAFPLRERWGSEEG